MLETVYMVKLWSPVARETADIDPAWTSPEAHAHLCRGSLRPGPCTPWRMLLPEPIQMSPRQSTSDYTFPVGCQWTYIEADRELPKAVSARLLKCVHRFSGFVLKLAWIVTHQLVWIKYRPLAC